MTLEEKLKAVERCRANRRSCPGCDWQHLCPGPALVNDDWPLRMFAQLAKERKVTAIHLGPLVKRS